MKHKFYHLTASADYLSFTFQSISALRIVDKKIEFVPISDKVYNLAFGDLKNEIDSDHLVVTNNRDSEQILATVVQALLVFWKYTQIVSFILPAVLVPGLGFTV